MTQDDPKVDSRTREERDKYDGMVDFDVNLMTPSVIICAVAGAVL